MNLSALFIRRPIMTILVMITALFFGTVAYKSLPISDLPNVEYPTIEVTTGYPGANPETVANTVTSPLEREFSGIGGLKTMSSSSSNSSSTIVLQFDLKTKIDVAAQDVTASINQAQPNLPSDLPNYPNYKKTNPADTPVLFLAVTSESITAGELYEYAYSFMGRRLGMVGGVSDVRVYGPPFAVRVQIDPDKLATHQIGINEVADALKNSTSQLPVGNLYGQNLEYIINVEGQMRRAEGYNNLIIRNNKKALLKIKDIGKATNSVQNNKTSLHYISKDEKIPCVIMGFVKDSDANTLDVIKKIKAQVKEIQKDLPASIQVHTILDETGWINSSIFDVQLTLLIAFILVILVVLFYLGKLAETIIPLLVLPISIIGTFGIMYLLGFSLDTLSLLAITLSIGFLVDDAVVVLENIVRHVEKGNSRWEAALNGAKQISFTVVSMTLCLSAIFIPLLFMPGIMGRIFREFSITIVTAILISGCVSLSLTPMLCSRFVAPYSKQNKRNWIERLSIKINNHFLSIYEKGLKFSLKHYKATLLLGAGSVIITILISLTLKTTFLPSGDLGFIQGFGLAYDGTSPYKMIELQDEISEVIRHDPYVEKLVAVGASPTHSQSMMFILLKDIKHRPSIEKVVNQLSEKLHDIPGIKVFLRPLPLLNLDVGTQTSMGNYQYVVRGFDINRLYEDTRKMMASMEASPTFNQVTSNMHDNNPYTNIEIDRDRASDLNISAEAIETALAAAYSNGRLTLINGQSDQYYLILETVPSAYKDPTVLDKIYISASSKTPVSEQKAGSAMYTTTKTENIYFTQVPLSEITKKTDSVGPVNIDHFNTLPSVIISYDLSDSVPLSTAISEINHIAKENFSAGISGQAIGSAEEFKELFKSVFILLIIAIFIIYVILGILYENFIHPITVMSALPPACLGAALTLYITNQPISVYALVGIILLLGIVLKNGIMMVEFANENINEGMDAKTAIYRACHERFRPIMMTTFAAMMGALPIALGIGGGADLGRSPLGYVIVGGLIVSQLLTLFFTPSLFLFLEILRERFAKKKKLKSNKL